MAEAKVARTTPEVPTVELNNGMKMPVVKESQLHRKSQVHATELLTAFECVKDVLLSLKSTLEYIDPALDKDEVFVGHLVRFERAFKRAKRLFLEPDNLA